MAGASHKIAPYAMVSYEKTGEELWPVNVKCKLATEAKVGRTVLSDLHTWRWKG